MVHLGAGAFFRSHQAWYTDLSEDATDWGIAAFTGRTPEVARQLQAQDGLFTLRVDGVDGPDDSVVASVSAAHAADDLPAWRRYFCDPRVTVLTCTVTEHGYLGTVTSTAWDDPGLRADLDLLRADGPSAAVRTAAGRLVVGLDRRRRSLGDQGAITLVPCDNLQDNGSVLERLILDVAREAVPDLVPWVQRQVAFVSTVVDRITPHASDRDREALRLDTGVEDPALVVAEPYTEWLMSGSFASARPAWESAGARFVPDLEPYARRKLHLLNGAHSLMAYAGSLFGHTMMSEAMTDDRVATWVWEWWDVVVERMGLPVQDSSHYCATLVERFANPAIRHPLAQTGTDGSRKLAVRVVPVLRSELEHGIPRVAAVRPIAAWVTRIRALGLVEVRDVDRALVTELARVDQRSAVRLALTALDLPTDDGLVHLLDTEVSALMPGRPS